MRMPSKPAAPDHDKEMPPCHLCGRDAAIVIDGNAWCEGCLHARGSCCAESDMAVDDKRWLEERCDWEA
jgi:hypothetical protein